MHTVYTDQFGAGQHVLQMYRFLRNQPPKIKKKTKTKSKQAKPRSPLFAEYRAGLY